MRIKVNKFSKIRRRWIYSALVYWGLSVIIIGFATNAYGEEAEGTNCPSTVSGLCNPGTFESST